MTTDLLDRLRAAVLLLALSGCGPQQPMEAHSPDQCLRVTLFHQCMAALPAGPVSTHYNDWDSVVDSCENSAYYQSLRAEHLIKPECRP